MPTIFIQNLPIFQRVFSHLLTNFRTFPRNFSSNSFIPHISKQFFYIFLQNFHISPYFFHIFHPQYFYIFILIIPLSKQFSLIFPQLSPNSLRNTHFPAMFPLYPSFPTEFPSKFPVFFISFPNIFPTQYSYISPPIFT